MSGIKLGESSVYPDQYDASLLEAIPRSLSRGPCGISDRMSGWDVWNAYELSWLQSNGVPTVAVAEFAFSSESKRIVESKSFKYYLNSFNHSVFASQVDVIGLMEKDLACVAEGEVKVKLYPLQANQPALHTIPGTCVDAHECSINEYQPSAGLLHFDQHVPTQTNTQIYSHLLRSNCPVTGQPDWGSIWLSYSGSKIDEVSFLKYVVSFRQYQGFHESCVERIFADILASNLITELTVYARYTRRGGLDINPFRSTHKTMVEDMPFGRTLRQ